jgi:hypothetical protein
MVRLVRFAPLAAALLVLGCGQSRTEPAPADSTAPSERPSLFDPAPAGAIGGTVLWSGELPKVPPFEIHFLVTPPAPSPPRLVRDNPHAPAIDAESRGIAGAVVFLRKVDPRQARPWDHGPVTIEHQDRRLFVVQGDIKAHVGFVHQGDCITMVSRENAFNMLQADGAAFFSLPFPDPNQPLRRKLNKQGLVELTSGAGCYWMRAYLFVSDHPYFARSDARGRFELAQVPPGRYQIVCWLPNWHQKSQDRDPESGLVTRMFFHPAAETEQEVTVEATSNHQVDFTFNLGMFVPLSPGHKR